MKIMVAAAFAVITMATVCSCQGRTMKNMEPTGETVDVVISPLPDTDSSEITASEEIANPETE